MQMNKRIFLNVDSRFIMNDNGIVNLCKLLFSILFNRRKYNLQQVLNLAFPCKVEFPFVLFYWQQ